MADFLRNDWCRYACPAGLGNDAAYCYQHCPDWRPAGKGGPQSVCFPDKKCEANMLPLFSTAPGGLDGFAGGGYVSLGMRGCQDGPWAARLRNRDETRQCWRPV